MKKLVIALMLVTFAATAAFAVDSVTYENKKGNITFDHKKHAEMGCDKCHEGTPAKIDVKGMKPGHALCKDCHSNTDKAMAKCDYCHKK
jgi:formylmethanofuran dehydrogenase subunit E